MISGIKQPACTGAPVVGCSEVMQSFVLAPAPGMSEVVLEPYNSALCFQDLLEYTDQVQQSQKMKLLEQHPIHVCRNVKVEIAQFFFLHVIP